MTGGTITAILGGVACAIVAALIVVLIASYNRLVRLRGQADASWAQIDAQLRRRYELVPVLAETVRAYAAQERRILEAVLTARGNAISMSSAPLDDRALAEAEFGQLLARLTIIADRYPSLRADRTYTTVQVELANAADRLAYARQQFGVAVESYNEAVQGFPSSLIASAGGFRARGLFQVAGDDRGPLQVRY